MKELKETISKLKAKNRRLKKDKDRLVAELQTLKKAFSTSKLYIDERLGDIPVEDVVRYFAKRKNGKLDEVVDQEVTDRDCAIEKFQNWINNKKESEE